jgi:PTH1 family peptidyl-tRNA hydrolase
MYLKQIWRKVTLILPDTFMNKSGASVAAFVKTLAKGAKKGLENVVVVYDDLDLPLGVIKVSYNKGTGGHRGLESVAKVLKTKQFVRVRVGISPATAKGAAKKPMGEEKVLDFILGKFKPSEKDELKKIFKTINEALECIVTDGYIAAMNRFN